MGIILEEKMEVLMTGRRALEEGFDTVLAMGAKSQVLSGEMRGYLGTGGESLPATVQGVFANFLTVELNH